MDWTTMQPGLFDIDTKPVQEALFARPDKCGTMDLFDSIEAPAPVCALCGATSELLTLDGAAICRLPGVCGVRHNLDATSESRALKVTDPDEGRTYTHDYQSPEITLRAARRLVREGWMVEFI